MNRTFLPGFGLLALALVIAGCGSGRPLVPVTGQVFVNQQPAVGAFVVLSPDEPGAQTQWPNGFPRAVVQADGVFTVSTNIDGDGAPAGGYTLLITWPLPTAINAEGEETETTETPPDRLQGRYATREVSPLKAEVRAGNTQLPRIDLTGVPQ